MAEVQLDPSTGRMAFALIAQDHVDLRPASALDQFRHGPAFEDRGVTQGDGRSVGLEQLEQPLVTKRCHLRRLSEAGPKLSLGKGPEQVRVDEDRRWLVKGTDEVLALGQI